MFRDSSMEKFIFGLDHKKYIQYTIAEWVFYYGSLWVIILVGGGQLWILFSWSLTYLNAYYAKSFLVGWKYDLFDLHSYKC